MQTDDTRRRAYRAGARMTRERMAREAPMDAAALDEVRASDILVVPGQYDHVEQVLGALEMPFTPIHPHQLVSAGLRPEQLLMVNCPGLLPRPAFGLIRDFVAAGGSLFTTDWALRHVLEQAFPGVLAYNDRPTGDEVVRIEVREHDNPFLRGVMDPGDEPLWWLEGSSYPIRILDPGRVEVLIRSRELGERHGEEPVAVVFREGEGEVFHMISHYYLQRTELRSARDRMQAGAYAQSKGVTLSEEDMALPLADVESAASSARLFANLVARKKQRSPK